MSYDALAVANYLVRRDLRKHRRPTLTNMALQKILYFADGRYLATHGRPLFDDRIEAWEYGPVVPDVYHAFKSFGASPITRPASRLATREGFREWVWETPDLPETPSTEDDRRFLDEVLDDYGRRSAVDLMAESHRRGGPWDQVYSPGARRVAIPVDAMREYFASHS